VRFAFKTAPQNTTWSQLLAVWQEADGIEHGLDLAIVYLRPPLSPAILAPLADALAPLR
jgi:hypothetical protein